MMGNLEPAAYYRGRGGASIAWGASVSVAVLARDVDSAPAAVNAAGAMCDFPSPRRRASSRASRMEIWADFFTGSPGGVARPRPSETAADAGTTANLAAGGSEAADDAALSAAGGAGSSAEIVGPEIKETMDKMSEATHTYFGTEAPTQRMAPADVACEAEAHGVATGFAMSRELVESMANCESQPDGGIKDVIQKRLKLVEKINALADDGRATGALTAGALLAAAGGGAPQGGDGGRAKGEADPIIIMDHQQEDEKMGGGCDQAGATSSAHHRALADGGGNTGRAAAFRRQEPGEPPLLPLFAASAPRGSGSSGNADGQEEEVGGFGSSREAEAEGAAVAKPTARGEESWLVLRLSSRAAEEAESGRKESGALAAGGGASGDKGKCWWSRRNDDDGVVATARSRAWTAPTAAAHVPAPTTITISDDGDGDRCLPDDGAGAAGGGPELPKLDVGPAKRRMRSRSREARRLQKWEMAREDVRIQCLDLDIRIVVHQPLLDVHADEWRARLRYLLKGAKRRPVYIGTTSDPQWRFVGGAGFLENDSDDDGRRRRDKLRPHRLDYKVMHVIASLPDRECAEAERIAINLGLGSNLNNKVNDARGLEIRSFRYSYLYVCIGG